MKLKWNYLLIPLVTVFVAVTGSYFTNLGMDWYATLTLPAWTPSWWFIGMVWTVIFLLSTLSALLFWNSVKYDHYFTSIVLLFIANVLFNMLRSWLFFVEHMVFISVIEMVVLFIITIMLIIIMRRKHKLASILLWIYPLWVAIATYFAYSVWILN